MIPLDLTFPYINNLPAKLQEDLFFLTIPFRVFAKLFDPKRSIGFRHREIATGTAIPEATVNEQCHLMPGKDHVWPTWNSFPMDTISLDTGIPNGFTQG
jgi:hypothetical protein